MASCNLQIYGLAVLKKGDVSQTFDNDECIIMNNNIEKSSPITPINIIITG
jgi:hypothetical protein